MEYNGKNRLKSIAKDEFSSPTSFDVVPPFKKERKAEPTEFIEPKVVQVSEEGGINAGEQKQSSFCDKFGNVKMNRSPATEEEKKRLRQFRQEKKDKKAHYKAENIRRKKIKPMKDLSELLQLLEGIPKLERKLFTNQEFDEYLDKSNGTTDLKPLQKLTSLLKGFEFYDSEDTNYVAIDCEMVGTGPKGSTSVVGRVSIVDYFGNLLLDTFVKVDEPITDYRTWISGIKKKDLKGAPPFSTVQGKVLEILGTNFLVGHSLQADLEVLKLDLKNDIQKDISRLKFWSKGGNQKVGLRGLTTQFLQLDIQSGKHSSVEDALASMALFRKFNHLKSIDF